MTKRFLIIIALLCSLLVCFTFTVNNHNEKQDEPSLKIKQELKDYVLQDYEKDNVVYEPLSTNIYPIYYYTPSEISECSKYIAYMELTMESVYPDTLYQWEDFRNCNMKLCELLQDINSPDSIRTQIEWLIVHTYRIKPSDAIYTNTFHTDMYFNRLREISNLKGDILIRRDFIIEDIIKRNLYNKTF